MTAVVIAASSAAQSEVLPNLTTQEISHFSIGSATAAVRFNADGTVDKRVGSTYTQINALTDWIIPNAHSAGNYEIQATLSAGDIPTSGALESWQPLSSGYEWTNIQSVNGVASSDLLIEIKKGSTVLASGTYSLVAEND